MRHPAIAALYRHWQDKCGGRLAPRRIDIEPKAISSELRDVFLLDGLEPGLPFRLAGSRMVETLGRGLTGVAFRALWTENAARTVDYALDCVSGDGKPVLIGIRLLPHPEMDPSPGASDHKPGFYQSPRFSASNHGSAEMLLLPLLHQGRLGGRILGGFVRLGAPYTGPQQAFALDALGTRVLGDAARPNAAQALLHGAVAKTVISRHGHLVLMQGFKDQRPS